MRFVVLLAALFLNATGSGAEAERKDPAAPRALEGTNLPFVLLDTKESIVSDRKVACLVRTILPPGMTGNVEAVSGVVRIHGGVSQGYAKTSYGLTLDAPVPWLGLRPSTHWVLNAAFVDRSLMRHKLSYDLFRSLSAVSQKRYAAESRFVEMRLNSQYHGAYLLMQRVDRALLELQSYDSNAPSHACIYKAVDHSANFSRAGHAGYEQHRPDAMARPYWEPLEEFNRFVSDASNAEFRDPQKGIATRLNIDNAIDFQLLVLLTSNLDGITKNFIFARDAATTNAPTPRFFFAPWDYDATFGRNWDGTPVEPTAWLSNHLFDRLQEDIAFRKRFAMRWKHLREREFSVATLHGLIDDNARALGEAALRNTARWSAQQGAYPDRLTFAEDLGQMKEWVVARMQWLDAEIARRGR
jgi:spore coat protein H